LPFRKPTNAVAAEVPAFVRVLMQESGQAGVSHL
jgi:hypothetical protein